MIRMRRPSNPIPPSEALIHEWRSLMICAQSGDGLGGSLRDRTVRANARAARLRWVESVLCERSWAEPTVDPR